MSKAFFATSAVLYALGYALALYFASEIMVGASLVVSMLSFGAWALCCARWTSSSSGTGSTTTGERE